MSDFKEIILQNLNKLSFYYKKDISKKFQLKALMTAIQVIQNHPLTVQSADTFQFYCKHNNIKGIGKGIVDRMDEIIHTGTLREFQEYETTRNETNDIIDLFMSITGVGDKRAKEWYDLGYRTIDDIKGAIDGGVITSTHHINMGLKYYEDMKERIPRNEIDRMKIELGLILKEIDEDLIFEICGSYRRGQETSGDMDVIISNPNCISGIQERNYLKRVVEKCVEKGFIIDHLTEKGDKKYMGFCKLLSERENNQEFRQYRNGICPLNGGKKKGKKLDIRKARRIDIRVFDYMNYWAGIIYFTGNKEFNIRIRNRALERGYSLNEYGLTKMDTKEKILLNNENEIFELLDIEYKSPQERN